MRKLILSLDTLDVESFDVSPRRPIADGGTVEAFAAEAYPAEQIKHTYEYRTCGGCYPYTQDMAYPECVCDLSRTCPTLDPFACPVEAETKEAAL